MEDLCSLLKHCVVSNTDVVVKNTKPCFKYYPPLKMNFKIATAKCSNISF